MVRLKFLLFALLVLGLGLAHLPMLSAPLGARAVEGASLQAASGTGEVARRVDARRAEVQSLALKLAGSPQVAAAVRALTPAPAPKSPRDRYGASKDAEETGGMQPLTAERFGALRTAAEAGLPQELQGAVVAVVAGDAVFHARAGAEPSSDTAALDVAALAKAGTSVVDAFGAPHVFASVPLAWSGEGTPAPALTLVVGAPLAADAALQGALDASGAAAVGLAQGDKMVGGVGAAKDRLEGALPRLPAGAKDTVLDSGSLQALGPVQLPAFTQGDAMGGQAPLLVGSRQALTGTPYEVVVLASTAAMLAPLAAYQHTALLALAGLFVLSLVWTALMGGGKKSSDEETVSGGSDTLGWGAAMAAQQSAPAAQPVAQTSPPAPAAVAPVAADPFGSSAASEPLSNPFGSAAHSEPLSNPFGSAAPPAADPFGGADAFPFPGTPAPAADPFAMPPPAAAPLADPFAMPPPQSAAPFAAPPPAAAPLADPFAGVESFPFPSPPAAYPPPAAEPFAPPPAYGHGGAVPFEHPAPSSEPIAPAAPRAGAFAFEDQPTAAYSLQQAANPFALAAAQSSDPESPETTRVAAIPRELLQASTRPTSEAIPMPAPRSTGAQAIPLPMPGVNGAAAAALSEEQHFQDVFREFVTTRERCGEQADGLTYDKFVQKLRKNKEQLVTKYACKTVRFQVYVKEGKAALKATPVKD
ncbi:MULTISPECIES: MXAN_5187 family protein [unclassified Corallococcus]|uniref:MXAN_5187 family protein n=1 Tax=unclassified Corallococcus TaxID=2685029 RepID=UPI001A8C2701|nr:MULTISPECIES: MXAN_5187 family protein [unclassified Corallococcus]MBN9686932.1 cell division protein FtsK [Corallococcus sp. NCSPR001]WAS89237.1 cell division protein FtsK [Corallococcus sp. NCRR]